MLNAHRSLKEGGARGSKRLQGSLFLTIAEKRLTMRMIINKMEAIWFISACHTYILTAGQIGADG
ncbi:hypothetical protein AWM70_05820 [Paenibacillus yonginensis]|uniref:Uncharacterized protein n=1 Tax=Paenibacillus yonginensis TaxID=1462996 RepID=A0A1B1MYB7_9BACL|nr:hypothetical protein AWM70_05820 [Paenibacillus yonginensis]